MKNISADVDKWLKNYNNQHRKLALENASRNFNNNDALDVHILEAIMGRESSFGDKNFMGKAGSSDPAGYF